MTPIDILAAARNNPVGPYLAPEDGWLKGWCGPVGPIEQTPAVLVAPDFRPEDQRAGPWTCAAADAYGWEYGDTRSCRTDEIRLDTRRPEVRHLLCDLGIAPEWARKSAVACWCSGMGVVPEGIEEMPDARNTRRWSIGYDVLRARCILAEKDGYYVPLADGGIGWWAT